MCVAYDFFSLAAFKIPFRYKVISHDMIVTLSIIEHVWLSVYEGLPNLGYAIACRVSHVKSKYLFLEYIHAFKIYKKSSTSDPIAEPLKYNK